MDHTMRQVGSRFRVGARTEGSWEMNRTDKGHCQKQYGVPATWVRHVNWASQRLNCWLGYNSSRLRCLGVFFKTSTDGAGVPPATSQRLTLVEQLRHRIVLYRSRRRRLWSLINSDRQFYFRFRWSHILKHVISRGQTRPTYGDLATCHTGKQWANTRSGSSTCAISDQWMASVAGV